MVLSSSSSSNNISQLETLLISLKELHEGGLLSLKQLVAVHQGFLSASLSSSYNNNSNNNVPISAPGNGQVADTRETWLQALTSAGLLVVENDQAQKCLDSFLLSPTVAIPPASLNNDEDDETRRNVALQKWKHQLKCKLLLVVQCLWDAMSQSSGPSQKLALVFLPWISLAPANMLELLLDESGTSDNILWNVLLDAAFDRTDQISENDNLSWLTMTISWIIHNDQSESFATSPQAQLLYWKVHTQCLIRLSLSKTEKTDDIYNTMLTLTKRGILTAVPLLSQNSAQRRQQLDSDHQQSFFKPSHLLEPIVHVMIPRLLPDAAGALWEFVWSNILLLETGSSSAEGANEIAAASDWGAQWTVGTAVLCAMLPRVCSLELPLPSINKKYDNKPCRPLEQPPLWELIQTCLRLGIHLTKKNPWIKDQVPTQASSQGGVGGGGGRMDAAMSELLRCRGLYLLRVLVENDMGGAWNKYIACLETMEMENEPHLIAQVWDTVQELATNAAEGSSDLKVKAATAPPSLSWDWMHILWARVMLSPDLPSLRKASLCQFCMGKAGVLLESPKEDETAKQGGTAEEVKNPGSGGAKGTSTKGVKSKKQQQSKKKKKKNGSAHGLPLHMVTNDFVLHVLVPCFDSLEQTVGTHHHYEEGGKTIKQNLTDLMTDFVRTFLKDMVQNRKDINKLENFIEILLQTHTLTTIRSKTAVYILELMAAFFNEQGEQLLVTMSDKYFFQTAANVMTSLFSTGYIVPSYRDRLTVAFAQILSRLEAPTSVPVDPLTVLEILKLYPLPSLSSTPTMEDASPSTNWIEKDASYSGLQTWLNRIQVKRASPSWGSTLASTVATAFVDGRLTSENSDDHQNQGACSPSEVALGRSIVLLCALLQDSSSTPSELLWPAINKGLSLAPAVALNGWSQADKVGRALILVEFGCKLQVLSGNGNGDLVVDRQTKQMMPPPPSIEQLLSSAAQFLFVRARALLHSDEGSNRKWNCSRSTDAKRLSLSFLGIIGSLQTLKEGFPSNLSLSSAADKELEDCFDETKRDVPAVEQISMAFAAVAAGAHSSNLLPLCKHILSLAYTAVKGADQQPLRSLFACSKWGTLDMLSRQLIEDEVTGACAAIFFRGLFCEASDSVEACPLEGLVFLFNCIAVTTKGLMAYEMGKETKELDLGKVIDALFSVLDATDKAADSIYILDELSSLLFSSEMLMTEYRSFKDRTEAPTPIRNAFRRLRTMAGTQRPHLLQVALARICAGWVDPKDHMGQAAIMYRDDIVELLYYKEDSLGASSVCGAAKAALSQSKLQKIGAHEQSVVRAIVLCLLDGLPKPGPDLFDDVKKELLEYVILRLLRDSKSKEPRNMVMLGSPEFCQKIRSWQALCILSRYVSVEIAEQVCAAIFETLGEQMHGQIRYFVEVFCIQCSRAYPEFFGPKIAEQITRRDLNLQEISSIMVIAGNLVVGKYRKDFLVNKDVINIHTLLAGASPWLSSTQGFSRAIAQLLVHELIPLAIDIKQKDDSRPDSDWHLRSLYYFLDENQEMKRLRSKQMKFFDSYDVDTACTPEHVFTLPVDEGGDCNPENMIDLIKKALADAYDEARGEDAPAWKQVKDIMESEEVDQDETKESPGEVNFQRKIIPLETLNLTYEEARQLRLRNVAGRRKQPLTICASLIDKVPNLGGLARSAEIFAASKLVIPDLRVTKMDNFTSLSVGAGDWIDIEECTEENLLDWLLNRRKEGCFIVGVEQTSSSVSLMEFHFPEDKPVVLLLGKEKEGIPVKFLYAVDQCVEIPQLGVIRSLNVHVSGAISIWEYTRQRILSGKVDIS